MRKTARPVVWEGGGAKSPSLDLIQGARPTSAALKVDAFEGKKVDHENRVPLFGLVCLGCGTFWVSLFGLILGFGHG